MWKFPLGKGARYFDSATCVRKDLDEFCCSPTGEMSNCCLLLEHLTFTRTHSIVIGPTALLIRFCSFFHLLIDSLEDTSLVMAALDSAPYLVI